MPARLAISFLSKCWWEEGRVIGGERRIEKDEHDQNTLYTCMTLPKNKLIIKDWQV